MKVQSPIKGLAFVTLHDLDLTSDGFRETNSLNLFGQIH